MVPQSTDMTSPSFKTAFEEGIPCTTCSFTEAHIEFGKPPYPKKAGTAPLSLMNSSAILSS